MEAHSFLMPFGKHEGQALSAVPGTYLMQLYTNREKMEKHPELKHFIEFNFGPLLPGRKATGPICDTFKICYVDKEMADRELKRIRSDPRHHSKPTRSYECDRCGLWHHTSKPIIKQKGGK
jgi:hypothetical protein